MIVIAILLVLLFPTISVADVMLSQHIDILKLLTDGNYELQIAAEDINLAKEQTRVYRSTFHPSLVLKLEHLDDKKQPFTSFQTSRKKNNHISASVRQRIYYGFDFSIGIDNDNTKMFGLVDSSSPNMPRNARFYQPNVYANLSVNLSKNFLGKRDRRELNNLRLKEINSLLKKDSSLAKLYYQSIGLFWEEQSFNEMIEDIKKYIVRLSELQENTQVRVERKTAEKGDLYSLRATIASKTAEVLAIGRVSEDANTMLKLLLGIEDNVKVQPKRNLKSILKEVVKSENEILSISKVQDEWSSSSAIQTNEYQIAKNSKITSDLSSLPDVKLYAKYSTTGTREDFSDSYSDVRKHKFPQYALGISFDIPLTTSSYHSKRALGLAQENSARLRLNKTRHNNISQLRKYQQQITKLRYEYEQILIAKKNGDALLDDLRMRYEQGRLSLFELIIEEGKILEIDIQAKKIIIARLKTLLGLYVLYDKYPYNNSFLRMNDD